MTHIGGDQRHARHQIGPVGCQHPGDAIAEGMPGHQRGPMGVVRDHRRHVGRIIVQIDAAHRAAAPTDATWLWPQHAKSSHSDAFGDRIEIAGAATERRQQHHRMAVALGQDFDLGIAVADQAMRYGQRHCHAAAPDCGRVHVGSNDPSATPL